MAISKVADRATVSSNSTVTTADFVLTGMTVGNLLIITTAADNSGGSGAARTVTVTNQSGTPIDLATDRAYQQNNDPGAASAGTTCNVILAQITATSGTVRLTYSGSVVQAGIAEEWTGINPIASAVVGTPVQANGTTTNLASLAETSVAQGNLAYAAVSIEGPNADTFTQDADTTNGSWSSVTKVATTNATADTNQAIVGGYKIVSATGAQTYNATNSVARDSAGILLELAAYVPVTVTGVAAANISITATAIGGVPGTVVVVDSVTSDQENTTNSNKTLTYSQACETDDLLVIVAAVQTDTNPGTIVAPTTTSGSTTAWTPIITSIQPNGSTGVGAWWAAVTSDGTINAEQTTTQVASQVGARGAMFELSGAHTTVPIGGTDTHDSAATDPLASNNSLEIDASTGSLVIVVGADWTAGTITADIDSTSDSGFTEVWTGTTKLEAGQTAYCCGYTTMTGDDTTTRGVLDASGATGDWAAAIFEVLPSAVAAATKAPPPIRPAHLRHILGR